MPDFFAMKKRNVFKEIALFSTVNYIALSVYAVVYLIVLKFLGPVHYGTWVFFSTLLCGVKFISLGASEGMVRQVALYASGESESYVRDLQQTTFWWGTFFSCVVATVLLIASLRASFNTYRLETMLCAFAFIVLYILFYVYQKLKSENRITVLSYYYLADVLLAALLYLVCMYHFGVVGLLLAVIIKTGILLCFAANKGFFTFRLRFRVQALKELLSFGFPMMLLSLCFYMLTHIDNIFIFLFLGKESAGLYGVAAILSRALLYFPFSVAIVLFPKIMATYGKGQGAQSIEDFYIKPVRFLMFFAPFFIGVVCILLPIPLTYIVPQYIDALKSIRILALGTSTACFLLLATYMLIAFNRQIFFLIASVCLVFLGVFLDIVVILNGYGIEGVAYATAIVFFLQSVIWNMGVLSQLGYSIKANSAMMFKLYSPLAYCVLILIPIVTVTPFVDHVISNVCIQLCIFCIFMFPCIKKTLQYKDDLFFEDSFPPQLENGD
jgi:O-antigen/teichoic acid export membrane protein